MRVTQAGFRCTRCGALVLADAVAGHSCVAPAQTVTSKAETNRAEAMVAKQTLLNYVDDRHRDHARALVEVYVQHRIGQALATMPKGGGRRLSHDED